MHIRRISAIIALAASGAAGVGANVSVAEPAGAATIGAVLKLDRTASTSGTALVVCNTNTADRAWSVRTYEETLSGYSDDELTAIGEALANGTESLARSFACSGRPASRSVSVMPGHTAFTRMPLRPYSTASERVNPSRADFAVT